MIKSMGNIQTPGGQIVVSQSQVKWIKWVNFQEIFKIQEEIQKN